MNRKYFIAWNESRNEGVIFTERASAESAIDGKSRYDLPDVQEVEF